MKIGLIRMRYTPFGGAEVFLKRFMEELGKRGHTIEVFSSEWEDSAGVKVRKVKAPGPSFLRPLNFANNACRAVEKARPDVVVSLERTFCQEIYRAGDGCHSEWLARRGVDASWMKRLSIILNPLHMTLLLLEEKVFRSPRLRFVVANSMMVKDDIMRHYGLPAEKICVIYNGIDAGAFERAGEAEIRGVRDALGLKKDSVLLLFVGSGFERKGLKYLIRALGALKDRGDIRLLVIGKGRPGRYMKEADLFGVGGRVVFKGPVKGVKGFYQASDIFVLPSIYEPFSNACLEAMAAGLPVVTSRANGASEIIEDGVNGAIVEDPADTTGLSEKIALFLDGKKRAEAGRLAREEALRHPIERNVTEFLKVVEEARGKDPADD